MTPGSTDPGYETNRFALQAISQTSEHRHIVAARDIFDIRGVKLWAENLRISPKLHQRLIERKLQHPLETSLRVEDGVDAAQLLQAFEAFISGDDFLARFAGAAVADLRPLVSAIPLEPVAQLLLTAAQQVHPQVFDHAVRGMALAGSLALRTQAPPRLVELAVLGGLLHDIGEMYVNPDYQRGTPLLGPAEFRHVTAHPAIGAALLKQLSGYPEALCRAVREHHERLDGTGYPAQLQQSAISPLGQLLAQAEVMLGLGARGALAAGATSFALRFVPGELNAAWSGPVVRAAEQELGQALPPLPERVAAASLPALRLAIDELLDGANALHASRNRAVARVAQRASHRLLRLRQAGHAMGLWVEVAPAGLSARERLDMALATQELLHRLRTLSRDCLWPEGDARLADDIGLGSLWLKLEGHLMLQPG